MMGVASQRLLGRGVGVVVSPYFVAGLPLVAVSRLRRVVLVLRLRVASS